LDGPQVIGQEEQQSKEIVQQALESCPIEFGESNSNSLPLQLPVYFKKFPTDSNEISALSTAEQLFYSVTQSEDDCVRIECLTRDQRNSEEWHQQRKGRLTASDFHNVYAMQKQTNPTMVAKRVVDTHARALVM